jgi:WD40 repeat protein
LWDAQTGAAIGEPLEGHTNWVWTLAFSPDGQRLVSGSFDGTLRVWETETWQSVTTLTAHGEIVRTVAFETRGRLMVSGGEDARLIIWDTATFEPRAIISTNGKAWGGAFSPDGAWLVSASDQPAAQMWNLRQRDILGQSYTGQTQAITQLAFIDNQLVSLSNSLDDSAALNTLARWEAVSAMPRPGSESNRETTPLLFTEPTPRLVTAIALRADGKWAVTSDQSGLIQTVDAATGEPLGELWQAHEVGIFALALSADGSRMATGDQNGVVQLWQRAGEGEADQWQPLGEPLVGHIDRVLTLAFSPDGRYLASGGRDTIVRLWEISEAGVSTALGGDLIGHDQPVISLVFNPDSTMLASGGRDNAVVLWEVATQTVRRTLANAHVNWVSALAFSPNGQYLASGSRDETVIVWDVLDPTVRRIGAPIPLRTPVTSVAFNRDGTLLGMGGENGTVQTWNVQVDTWLATACAIANRNLTDVEWRTYMHDMGYETTCN